MRIPDLPGSYGGGASADAAVRDAASAAREWLMHRTGEGLEAPKTPGLDETLASGDIDVAACEAAALIGVLVEDRRTEQN